MEFEKKIVVLGSTGSIGTQTLEIAREYKGIKIEAMSAHSNVNLIEKQAREFKPKTVCLTDEEKAKDLKIKLADTDIKAFSPFSDSSTCCHFFNSFVSALF